MKKRAIFFLLTIFSLSAFAVEGVGDFSLGLKIDSGNVAQDTRDLVIKPWFDFSRNLNDNLNLYLKAELPITTGPLKQVAPGVSLDEFLAQLNGSFAVGPGKLGFYLKNNFAVPIYGKERIGKAGRDLKPGDLSYKITPAAGYTISSEYGSFDAFLGADLQVYEHRKAFSDPFRDLFLSLGYSGDAGVSATVKPYLDIQPNVRFGGLYAKFAYANENVGAGIEVDQLPAKFDIAGAGFPLDFFCEGYLLAKALTLGGHLKFGNLGNKTAGRNKVSFNPGVYGIYRF
jgi:hypothetical protein